MSLLFLHVIVLLHVVVSPNRKTLVILFIFILKCLNCTTISSLLTFSPVVRFTLYCVSLEHLSFETRPVENPQGPQPSQSLSTDDKLVVIMFQLHPVISGGIELP